MLRPLQTPRQGPPTDSGHQSFRADIAPHPQRGLAIPIRPNGHLFRRQAVPSKDSKVKPITPFDPEIHHRRSIRLKGIDYRNWGTVGRYLDESAGHGLRLCQKTEQIQMMLEILNSQSYNEVVVYTRAAIQHLSQRRK